MRRLGWAVVVAACVLVLAAAPAGAQGGGTTYVVDHTADDGASACTVAPDDCTLRAAINAANANAGADTITFSMGAGTHTLVIGSALPAITESVTIDGYSSTGASANTQASFTNAFSADGLGSNAVLKIEL